MQLGGGLRRVLVRMLALALWAASAVAGQDAIYFERHFPGAVPERFEVRLAADGSALYVETDEDSVELSIGADEVEPLFKQATGLEYFARPLSSNRKVASTGRKVLRYESGGEVLGEAVFDYSEVKAAREIASWFVKLAETQQHLRELERTYRFDRLGVNQALVSLEQAFERDRVAAPGLLAPILCKISQQERIVHLARARAGGLLERMRSQSRSQFPCY